MNQKESSPSATGFKKVRDSSQIEVRQGMTQRRQWRSTWAAKIGGNGKQHASPEEVSFQGNEARAKESRSYPGETRGFLNIPVCQLLFLGDLNRSFNCSVTKLCPTLRLYRLQHARLPYPLPFPRVCPTHVRCQ